MGRREDEWVVLSDHVSARFGAPLDTDGMELVFLEQILLDAGIDAAFDPYRPGEGGVLFTQMPTQPVRLMVKSADLERAQAIAREAFAEQE